MAQVTELSEPRMSLGEAAYRRLRDDIIACRLAPGQRLTEKQLKADTGFGLAPLRDALTRLDHEGLIRTLPHKGYQVTPLTPKSIDDLFVVWEINGPELIRLAIRRATDEQIAAAQSAFEELDRLTHEQGGAETAVRDIEVVNATFGILTEATGNAYLITLFQRLAGDMGRIRAADRRLVEDVQDADEAAAKARRYIEEIHRRVLQVVVRWPSVMTSEVVVSPVH